MQQNEEAALLGKPSALLLGTVSYSCAVGWTSFSNDVSSST